jgi:uncharacterized protein YkwD
MRRTGCASFVAMLVAAGPAAGMASAAGSPVPRPAATAPAARAAVVGLRIPAALPRHGSCRNASLLPSPANDARVAAATLCLIERERETHHLGLLRSNGSLQRIASSQAREMVAGDYFGDDSLSGWTPMQRIEASRYGAGATSVAAAQNIGWGTISLSTPAAMVRGWMLSPPHRKIILTGGYRDAGVGVAPAAPPSLNEGAPGATYTLELAARG